MTCRKLAIVVVTLLAPVGCGGSRDAGGAATDAGGDAFERTCRENPWDLDQGN